jgi:hypothetical protein
MKAKLLIIILVTSILYANGQVIESIGFKGGVSFSNQTYEFKRLGFTDTYDYKVGVYSVFTAELFKGKFLSLSTDLGFVQKGMKQEMEETTTEFPEGTGEYTTWKTTFGYVSLSPILKGFYNFSSFTTYALIGPRIDYRVMYEPHVSSQLINETNKLIWGITYGVGAEYKIKKFGIILECLGHPDFTAILEQEASEGNFGLKITGNSYIITTGLKYHMHWQE